MTVQPVEGTTARLAAILALAETDFVEIFGAAWGEDPNVAPHDYDLDPSGGLEADATPWHIAGQPAQLMIRVFEHGVFVATPHGVWSGPAAMAYEPRRQEYIGREDLTVTGAAIVRKLLTSRRRSFQYCRYCFASTPPESRFSDNTCHGCASLHQGVVY